MRRLCVLLMCVAVGGVAAVCPAADPLAPDIAYGEGSVGTAVIQDGSCPCPGWECGYGGCRSGHVKRKAQIGYFNCNCRGSYKFPVPPQYTYFWPGMYSQQTMTEYASPWRFPPLRPLSDDMAANQSDAPRVIVTTKGAKEESKPLARELKRLSRTK